MTAIARNSKGAAFALRTCLGNCVVAMLLALLASSSSAAPTSLDNEFGTAGAVVLNLATGAPNFEDFIEDIAIDRTGRAYTVSRCQREDGFSFQLCVTRFSPYGEIDSQFTGFTNTRVSQSIVANVLTNSGVRSRIALQSSGRVIIGLTCDDGTSNQRSNICLERFAPNGSFDASFGIGGRVSITHGTALENEALLTLAVDASDRIVFGGVCPNGSTGFDFCLGRYLAHGTPDNSFGNGGIVVSSLNGTSSAYEEINALALTQSGKIYAAGTCVGSRPNEPTKVCVARFTANGTLDGSFGIDGVVRAVFPNRSFNAQIVVQSDGNIVVGSTCQGLNSAFAMCMTRLLSDGRLDTSFSATYAPNGTVITEFVDYEARLESLRLLPDGRLLAVGACTSFIAENRMCMARFQADGYADSSFSSNGKLVLGSPTTYAFASALRADGKVLVGGVCKNATNNQLDSCLLQLQGGPNTTQTCSLDLDGDGLVTTTDSIVWSRVMFGGDSRALNGVSFPTAATRRDWVSIGAFLVRQCGLNVLAN
jgi:uncharacterized delta-60 repeat protein